MHTSQNRKSCTFRYLTIIKCILHIYSIIYSLRRSLSLHHNLKTWAANFPPTFQPHHPILIAINIKYLCRKCVFYYFHIHVNLGALSGAGKHQNQECWLAVKSTNVTHISYNSQFNLSTFFLTWWKLMPLCVMSKYGGVTQHVHRLAGAELVHTLYLCMCMWVCVSARVSGGLCPLLPISPGRRPLSRLPFLSLTAES